MLFGFLESIIQEFTANSSFSAILNFFLLAFVLNAPLINLNSVYIPKSGYDIGQKVRVVCLDCEDNLIVSYGIIVGKVYGHPEWLADPFKKDWVYYIRFYPFNVLKELSSMNLAYKEVDLIPHEEIELIRF